MRSLLFRLVYAVVGLHMAGSFCEAAYVINAWMEIGGVHILDGPQETWVFVETRKVTEASFGILTAPRKTQVASQMLFKLSPAGEVKKVALTKDGPGFHHNSCSIIRLKEGFYLYRLPSLGHASAIFKWRGDHFGPLGQGESEADTKVIATIEQQDSAGRVFDSLEAVSAENGWTCVAKSPRTLAIPSKKFHSVKHNILISVRVGDYFRPIAVLAMFQTREGIRTKVLVDVPSPVPRGRPRLSRPPGPLHEL
ncbi:hypothetical protein V5E97_29155 [Singulisphaera sp. Ch08]|uniref:Uncharacterized protein n=1 Tax=Singulisphaera sp. Ch08 TaxID=3120278 RepID=A0AAU7CCD7_9BACT